MDHRGSRSGNSHDRPDVSRDKLALGTLILLAAFVGAPGVTANEAGCSIRIGVVDGTGAPAPAGVVVRIAAGELAVERDWPGGTEAIELDAVPCGAVIVEAGYRQASAPYDVVRPFTSVESVLVPGVPGAAVLEVPALRSVRVRIRDRDDRPVPGVFVFLLPRSGFEARLGESVSRNTGHDGTFMAAVDVRETYEIRTPRSWADRGVTATLDGRPVEIPVMLAPGLRAAEVDYVVPSGHRVRVSVRDLSGGGVPAIGFRTSSRDAHGTSAPTAADGSSAVFVEALPAEIRPLDLAGAGWVFEPETVVVTPENEHETFTFVAHEHEGDTFVLRVTEVRTGNPVAGARLGGGTTGDCPEYVPTMPGRTDDDGVARVPCSPCSYWIFIDPPPGSVLMREVRRGEVSCDEGLSVELESGAVLTGSVRDVRGRPVAGLPLKASRGRGLGRNSTTDEEGLFELRGIGTGTWHFDLGRTRSPDRSRGMVLVRADARAGSVERLEPSVTIHSPDEKPEIDLQLVPGGLACVRLSDPDGNPVPVSSVEAFLVDGEEALSRNGQSSLVNHDEPDRLCTLPLAPGSYLLRAGEGRNAKVAYVPVWWPGEEDRALATAVEIEPGKTVELGPMIITLAGALLLEVPGVERPELEQLRVELRRYPEGTDQAEADDSRPWTTVAPHRIDFSHHKPKDPDPPPFRVWVRKAPIGVWDARVCVLPETDDEAGASEASSMPCWSLREPVEVRPNELTGSGLTFQHRTALSTVLLNCLASPRWLPRPFTLRRSAAQSNP